MAKKATATKAKKTPATKAGPNATPTHVDHNAPYQAGGDVTGADADSVTGYDFDPATIGGDDGSDLSAVNEWNANAPIMPTSPPTSYQQINQHGLNVSHNELLRIVGATNRDGSAWAENDAHTQNLASMGLIEVNSQATHGTMVAVRATPAATDYLQDNEDTTDAKPFVPPSFTPPVVNNPPAYYAPAVQQEAKSMNAPVKPVFAIEFAPIPAKVGNGERQRSSVYPFDELPEPQRDANGVVIAAASFFVPASDKHPEPAKSLQSAVSAATARYDVGTGEYKNGTVRTASRDENGDVIKGPDGKTVWNKTTDNLEVMRHTRIFKIFPAEGGARVYRVQ